MSSPSKTQQEGGDAKNTSSNGDRPPDPLNDSFIVVPSSSTDTSTSSENTSSTSTTNQTTTTTETTNSNNNNTSEDSPPPVVVVNQDGQVVQQGTSSAPSNQPNNNAPTSTATTTFSAVRRSREDDESNNKESSTSNSNNNDNNTKDQQDQQGEVPPPTAAAATAEKTILDKREEATRKLENFITRTRRYHSHYQPIDSVRQETIRELVEDQNADVDGKVDFDKPFVTELVFNGDIEGIRILIRNGAKLNNRDHYGHGPLSYLMKVPAPMPPMLRADIAKLLLENGANPNGIPDQNPGSPLNWAVVNQHHACVPILLKYRPDLSQNFLGIGTILHYACQTRNVEMAKMILSPVANGGQIVNINEKRPDDGNTPLHLAVQSACKNMVMLLLDHRCNKNPLNNLGETPLHIAVEIGCTPVAELLINSVGVALDQKRRDRMTPFTLAIRNQNLYIVKLIWKRIDSVTSRSDVEKFRNNHAMEALKMAGLNYDFPMLKFLRSTVFPRVTWFNLSLIVHCVSPIQGDRVEFTKDQRLFNVIRMIKWNGVDYVHEDPFVTNRKKILKDRQVAEDKVLAEFTSEMTSLKATCLAERLKLVQSSKSNDKKLDCDSSAAVLAGATDADSSNKASSSKNNNNKKNNNITNPDEELSANNSSHQSDDDFSRNHADADGTASDDTTEKTKRCGSSAAISTSSDFSIVGIDSSSSTSGNDDSDDVPPPTSSKNASSTNKKINNRNKPKPKAKKVVPKKVVASAQKKKIADTKKKGKKVAAKATTSAKSKKVAAVPAKKKKSTAVSQKVKPKKQEKKKPAAKKTTKKKPVSKKSSATRKRK